MKLPQNVYDVILSFWSAVKTIDERDYLHVNWFVMREMSCCSMARQATFIKARKTLLPEWYETFNKKSELHYELREKCEIVNYVCSMSGNSVRGNSRPVGTVEIMSVPC